MKKKIIKIALLSILPSLGWIYLGAVVPPIVFQSNAPVQVSSSGIMRVEGGMHMNEGAVITQNGLTVLMGDFIHDASTNVFTTDYTGTITGVVEFRGSDVQKVTTNKPAYTPQMAGGPTASKMDRTTMYLKFPDFKINNGNRVVITPSMGVSVNKLLFTSGRLRLKSDENGGNDQDASLLVVKDASGYRDSIAGTPVSGNYMEIERNVIYNLGKVAGTTGFKYFGFSAPLANMYLDYFTSHWVFDQRMNGGAGDYDIHRYHQFDPGIGYFVVVRQQPNTTMTNPTDSIRDGLLIQTEHFLFNRTFYPDFWSWNWSTSVPVSDKPFPQEVLRTSNVTIPGGLKTGDNYFGNPYTCALDVNALFTAWGSNIVPSMWIWSGQASNWLVITQDMSTMDGAQKVVPSQQMFVVEGVNNLSTFTIPASARTHNAHRFLRSTDNLPHNELLIEVQDWELDNFSRMAIGLRSWGKLSGDDESDAKWIKNEDVNVPQIYAVTSQQDTLSINSLPEDTRSTNFDFVPAQIAGSRKYIMRISRQESLSTPMAVLVDKKENKEINLLENNSYEFFADKDDNAQRFSILFAPVNNTRIDETDVRPREAYCQKQTLYIINNWDADIQKPVEIYNTSGLLVYQDKIMQAGTNTYELHLAEGVYIVKSGEMIKKIKI